MKKMTVIILTFSLLVIAILLLLIVVPQNRVEIINQSGEKIAKIVITTKKESFVIENLEDHRAKTINLNVDQDMNYKIEIYDENNQLRNEDELGYLTPGIKTYDTIEIDPQLNFNVRFRSNTLFIF